LSSSGLAMPRTALFRSSQQIKLGIDTGMIDGPLVSHRLFQDDFEVRENGFVTQTQPLRAPRRNHRLTDRALAGCDLPGVTVFVSEIRR
jgi:hypothetical protein